jgi:hypothetical protein
MSFTGKATYSAGATLPEAAEDVSDIIGIVSPYETPLLDHLGDAPRAAASTYHEWLEDEIIPRLIASLPIQPNMLFGIYIMPCFFSGSISILSMYE